MIKFLTISNNCNRQSSQKHVENNFSKQKSLFPVIQFINAERLSSTQRIEVRSALSTSQLVHNLFISLIIKGNNFCIWIYGYPNCLVPYICMYLQKVLFLWESCSMCSFHRRFIQNSVLASVTALYSNSGFRTTLPLIKHLYSHHGFKLSVEKCLWRRQKENVLLTVLPKQILNLHSS